MKPTNQTTFGEYGNCFAACVASMLEIPLEDVPNFYQDRPSGWWFDFENWLKDYGYFPIILSPKFVLPVYYIVSGPASRGFSHAVIYFDGELVFDPYPDGSGVDPKHIYIFIPIEIAHDNGQNQEE